ncbi:hypothetical protein AgCh_032353 [Apium graveolens]
MENSKRGLIPMSHGVSLSEKMSPKTPEERERMSKIPYASTIGSITYAMLCTRPDVAYSISVTSRYQSNPESDSKSMSGYVFTLNGGAIQIVERGDVNVERVDTHNNVADPLTKPLSRSHFDHHKDKMGERKILGPKLVQQTKEVVEVIQKRLTAAQDRQRKYADQSRKDMDFEEGNLVLLKVSPWKGLTRFGKKGKLSPRYVGPFEILKRVGKVAYELALPPHMEHIHNVFHVSMLKNYNPHSRHVIEYEPIELKADLSYVESPIEILEEREKVLRNRVLKLVRVLWRNPKVEELTWELESDMKEKYTHLFS